MRATNGNGPKALAFGPAGLCTHADDARTPVESSDDERDPVLPPFLAYIRDEWQRQNPELLALIDGVRAIVAKVEAGEYDNPPPASVDRVKRARRDRPARGTSPSLPRRSVPRGIAPRDDDGSSRSARP